MINSHSLCVPPPSYSLVNSHAYVTSVKNIFEELLRNDNVWMIHNVLTRRGRVLTWMMLE